jgi:hypothetical protein
MFACLRAALQGTAACPIAVQQSWCAGTAAMCLYLIVYQLVHFPLAEVNSVFTLALALGVTMAMHAHRHRARSAGRLSRSPTQPPPVSG